MSDLPTFIRSAEHELRIAQRILHHPDSFHPARSRGPFHAQPINSLQEAAWNYRLAEDREQFGELSSEVASFHRLGFAFALHHLGDQQGSKAQQALAGSDYPQDNCLGGILGDLHFGTGRSQEAATHYQSLVAAYASNPQPHFLLGRAQVLCGNLEDGISELREAITLRVPPQSHQYHEALGFALLLKVDYGNAQTQFQKSVEQCEQYGGSFVAHLGLAHALEGQGLEDQANIHYGLVADSIEKNQVADRLFAPDEQAWHGRRYRDPFRDDPHFQYVAEVLAGLSRTGGDSLDLASPVSGEGTARQRARSSTNKFLRPDAA